MANIFDEIEAEEVNPYDEIEAAPAPAAPAVRQPTQIRTPPDLLSGRQEVLGTFGGDREPITPENVRRARDEGINTLAQGGIGLQEGFKSLGEQGWSGVQLANEPILEFGDFALTLQGIRPTTQAQKLAAEARELAKGAKAGSKELADLSRETGGSQFARTLGQGITSVAPAMAAGPFGLPAVVSAAGAQGGLSTLAQAQDVFEQDPEERGTGILPNPAFRSALAPAAIDAAQTAAITLVAGKLFGPGVEGATTPIKQAAIRQTVGSRAKEVLGEALEEGTQQFLSDYVVKRMSYDPAVTFDEALEGAIESAKAGGILGAALPAIRSVAERQNLSPQDRAAELLSEQLDRTQKLDLDAINRQLETEFDRREGQRRVGVRIPEGEFAQPDILELADEAMREAQSPIRVPGQVPAIERLRNAVNPPKLAEVTTAQTKDAPGGVLPSRERRGPVVVAGEDLLQDLDARREIEREEAARRKSDAKSIDTPSSIVEEAPVNADLAEAKTRFERQVKRSGVIETDSGSAQSPLRVTDEEGAKLGLNKREINAINAAAALEQIAKETAELKKNPTAYLNKLENLADDDVSRFGHHRLHPSVSQKFSSVRESKVFQKPDGSVEVRLGEPFYGVENPGAAPKKPVATYKTMRELLADVYGIRPEPAKSLPQRPPNTIPFARQGELRIRPDADLIAIKPTKDGNDYLVKRYNSRKALEEFLKNPGQWRAVIKTQVGKNMVVHPAFQQEVPRETITPENDTKIGRNAAGEQLYRRADGSVYRMRTDRKDRPGGYPDFGGDLSNQGDETSLRLEGVNEPVAQLTTRLQDPANRVSTNDAVTTGIAADSVSDLQHLSDSWKQWKQRLDDLKSQAAKDPSKMMEYATWAQRGQLYREAVEAATSSGSHKVEARNTEFERALPEPKLDWRKNPQVAEWLVKNGPAMNINVSDVQSEGTSLSQGEASTEITIPDKAAVQTIVDDLKKQFPASAEVVVVENYHELPDSAHQAAYRQGANPVGINGAVIGGKVYIVSNNLESAEEARQIWLHEQAGHFATDKILGPKLNKFMEQVADSFAKDPLMADTKTRYKDASKSRLGREFIARLAENPQAAPNVWNKIVAKFREWLRSIGWVKTVSENDIRVLLNRSMENLRKKEAGATDEEISLSLKTAAEVAASRFPETPPTPSAPAAKAGPASTLPATGVKPNLDAVYKIFEPAKKTGPGLKKRGIDFIESVRTGFSSKFRPLNKLAQDIAKAYGRTSPKDVAGIFEQLNGSQGKAEADIYRFDQAVSKLVEGDEKDFSPYMFLRRSLDRLNQDAADIERAVAGEDVKKLNRRSVADYTIPQLEADLAALEQKLGPEKVSKFEQAAELYQQHMDAALRLQVESGRMSQKVYDAIKEGNQFYAPFKVMKYLEETSQPEGSGRRVDTLADFTKAMEGIEDADFRLGDMLAAARQSILMSRILADKNTAMRNVSELAAFDPDGMFIRRLKDGQKPQRGFEAVNVLEAGKPVRYEVNQDVSKALQIYGSTGADMFTRALSLMSTPFRAGATALNIPFQVGNLLIDTTRAALVSKYGTRTVQDMVQYPLDFVQAIYSSMKADMHGKQNKLYQDFLDSGVAGTTIQEYLTPEALKFKEPTSISKSAKLAQSVLSTIPRFAKAIEQTNKVLGVKRAMRIEGVESGKQLAQQVPEAITELRRFSGSPDFGRMGSVVDQYRLNLLLVFFNARLQGTILDVGRLGGRDGGKVAAQTWLKLGMPVAIATAFLYALNNRDEYREDYEQRPDQEKENYWLIPKDSYITNDRGEKMRDYWRIPKREISKWVANMTEQALDFAKRRDPKALADFGVRMAEELTPVNITGDTLQERTESVLSGLNPLLKMPLELGTGRSFYRHQDIIPENMKDASPESQFKPRTAEAFKKLGEAMPDFMPEALRSPLILENLTQNLTAGMITQFLPTPPVEGRSKLENTPLLRRFQAAPYTDDGGEQEMLDELKREAADERLKRHREATSLIDSNPGKSLSEILKMAPRDEKFLNHFADLWVAKENGITGRERQIIALPVRQRAAYVADQLSRLEGEAKQLKFQELARKRILTEAVYQELPNVMK